jgi:hypothetical protein
MEVFLFLLLYKFSRSYSSCSCWLCNWPLGLSSVCTQIKTNWIEQVRSVVESLGGPTSGNAGTSIAAEALSMLTHTAKPWTLLYCSSMLAPCLLVDTWADRQMSGSTLVREGGPKGGDKLQSSVEHNTASFAKCQRFRLTVSRITILTFRALFSKGIISTGTVVTNGRSYCNNS